MNFDQWRHYARARLFQALKKDPQAAAAYHDALSHNPRFAKATSSLGYLHAKQAQFDQARHWFEKTTAIKPDDAIAHFNLGFVLDKLGQREQAINAFREAVRLDKKLDRAWFGLGLALASLGRHEEAIVAFQEVCTLESMNPHAWYCLGMAYHHAHDPGKVKEIIEHLFRFDPVMTRKLIRDAERADLAHLVQDLLV